MPNGLAKTSRIMLNGSDESGHPYPVPDLSKNGSNFPPLSMMQAVCHIVP